MKQEAAGENLSSVAAKEAAGNTETAESTWNGLYKVGGGAALLAGLFFLIQIFGLVSMGQPPSTINGWFTLIQNNRTLFVGTETLDIASVALIIPMYLALYVALRRFNEAYATIATGLALVGIAVYFASSTVFSMLSLSDQYAAATTDAQRSLFLSAGQAMVAVGEGTGANMWQLLLSVASLIISAVMLRSKIFGKITPYLGILANVIGIIALVPAAGILFIVLVPLLGIWFILIGRGLHRLRWAISK